MHPPGQRIDAHEHDWPVLTLYRAGGYREHDGDGRSVEFDGPSIVFQPARAAHADEIGACGLETLALTFDPAWLTPEARSVLPVQTQWRPGGAVAAAAQMLADLVLRTHDENELRIHTSRFLCRAFAAPRPPHSAPLWGERVKLLLGTEVGTREIARVTSLNSAWLARAYRAWRGEGMAETVRRLRVERAALLLRGGVDALADIAIAAGFCDQSHMNRAFRAVLGRTPLEVRREEALLRPLAAPG
jgi:AraC family transcriptional regulator